MERENENNLIDLLEYIKNFNMHFELLLRRYNRFKEINNITNDDIDVITYLDMIVVQLRAICIENNTKYKNNYTVQNLLRKVGEEELSQKIERMLETPFIPDSDFTVRIAIKTLADNFICHYDNIDFPKIDLALAEIIEKRLRSPYDSPNLDDIMKVLISCVGQGLSIKV
ncbi:MAG: hypothetical protein IKE94_05615 [Aeriscardovia sp.]|nr:hypothetical protein [Aeriscardovia sp.]